MTEESRKARTAGAIYLLVVLTGIFSLIYVPARLAVPGDPAGTLDAIRAHQGLYRLGIAGLVLNQLALFFLSLALYRLLAPVDRSLSAVMVLACLAGLPLTLMSAAARVSLLDVLGPTELFTELGQAQRDALAMMARAGGRNALGMAFLFWGLWLLPFGILVFRSGFLPKTLGILLVLGCADYMIRVFGGILAPDFESTTLSSLAAVVGSLGELGTCLWLLIMGAQRSWRSTGHT